MPESSKRKERQICWEGRDQYFGCLDALSIIAPGEEGSKCSAQKKVYEKNCAKSWVQYFNTRRVLGEQQKEVLAAAEKQRLEAEGKGFKRDR